MALLLASTRIGKAEMTNWWVFWLGWPTLLVALVLSGFGTFQNRPWNLYTAAILILPVSLYLAATPRFAFVALLAPLALLLAGLAIKRNKINLAIVMVLPVVLFFSWLAMIVLQEPGSQGATIRGVMGYVRFSPKRTFRSAKIE